MIMKTIKPEYYGLKGGVKMQFKKKRKVNIRYHFLTYSKVDQKKKFN